MENTLAQIFTVEIITAFIALIALAATGVSTYFQRRHNRNSVKPLIDFQCYCSVSRFAVIMRNAGTGPMIVKSSTVTLDGEKKESVISCFDKDNLETFRDCWDSTYARIHKDGRTFIPGEELQLMSFTLKEEGKRGPSGKWITQGQPSFILYAPAFLSG